MDDDSVERWHCYPCGFGGDVFDLIMRLESVPFPESIVRAEEIFDTMPPGWEPRFKVASNEQVQETAETWLPMLREARQRALEQQNDGMLCVVTGILDENVDELTRRGYDRALRDVWGVGLDNEGNLLFPHITEDGSITGVKVRSVAGFKWSRPGSRYVELYGSWIDKRHRSVLVTEGETDADWAYMQDPGVDVRGLPKGAQNIVDRYLEQLRAWDVVYLALDADQAGIDATRVLLEELGERVRVCRLPQGHDLRSARPDLHVLMEEAIIPTPQPGGIAVISGTFHRLTQNGTRPLTSWYAEPTARLIAADDDSVEPAIELDLHYAGQTRREVVSATDMSAGAKFKKWTGGRALDCLMGDQDVQLMQSYFTARAQVLPDVYQTPRVGIHDAPHRYRYAGRSLVLPQSYIGKLPWRFVGPAEIRDKIHLDHDGPIDWTWLDAVLRLNHESVMHPILAWLGATARRGDVKNFPLLFIGGSSGAGKSTVAQLLTRMFGSTLGAQLGAITAFPLMRLMSATTTIPIFIDEWSRQSRADTREAFQGSVPLIYEGGIAERGRADQTVVQYRCTSPVLVAGEDVFALDREMDRMVSVEISRAGQSVEALERLSGQPLENFGYWYNRWLIEATELPPVPQGRFASRPEYNLEVLRCGWQTLAAFLEHAARYDPAVPELPDEPNLDLVNSRRDEHENEYEVLLREALGITDSNHHDLAWIDEYGTWVRFRALTSPDTLRRLDINLPGGAGAMKRYFENRGYEVTNARTTVPMTSKLMYASLIKGYFPKLEDA